MLHEKGACYQITLKGRLDPDWSDWLNGFDLCSQILSDGNCVTMITVEVIDQASLRGVLTKIWDLNLELMSLRRRDERNDAG